MPTNRRPLVRKPSSNGGGPTITEKMVEIFARMIALGPADSEQWYALLTLLDRKIQPRPRPWIVPLCPHWREPWQAYQADLAERLYEALGVRNNRDRK